MSAYTYTGSATLQAVMQDKLPVLTMDDPLFTDLMPIDHVDAATVIWEQKDNYTGLLTPRAYDTGFGRVQREGIKSYRVQPGVYGDQKAMLEEYMTVGREMGTFGQPLDIRKAQAEDQDHLLNRAIDRLRKIGWDLFTTGTYSVTGVSPTGAPIVYATDTFSIQVFAAITTWATLATATPLADLRAAKLKARGHGVTFGRRAKIYMNSTTVNALLGNTNLSDIGGRRTTTQTGQIQPMTLDQFNVITADQDLPMIVEYDEGYQPDPIAGVAQSFVTFIADYKAVLVGARRTGEAVTKFWMTRNANNMAAGRASTEVYTDFEIEKNPIRATTTLGFNGAPAVYFPSAIVAMTL